MPTYNELTAFLKQQQESCKKKKHREWSKEALARLQAKTERMMKIFNEGIVQMEPADQEAMLLSLSQATEHMLVTYLCVMRHEKNIPIRDWE